MNLIEPEHQTSIIASFREYQYLKLDYFIDLGIRYLQNFGLQVDSKYYSGINSIKKTIEHNYVNLAHFDSTQYKIKINDNDKKNWFLALSIPNLVHGCFFKLNQTWYIPILYIIDEPIVIKENSIKLDSLFQPITLFLKERRAIFLGINWGLNDFLNFLTWNWQPEYRESTRQILNLEFSKNINSITTTFANRLNCLQEYDVVKNKIIELFFDEYTLKLYNKIYNLNDFDRILLLTMFKKYEQTFEHKYIKFNDLRHKRLAFIEIILKSYFKSVAMCAKLLLNNTNLINIKMKLSEIVDHFFSILHGNSLYDTVNGFSGILLHKATFKNPFGLGELPKEVASIHWTHKGRICPNSISNHDPGQDIFLVPTQIIDTEYGLFHFKPEEMEFPS